MIFNKRKNFFERWSITALIIIVTSLISIISFIVLAFKPDWISYLALMPLSILQGKYLWTLLTHIFVHGGLTHLLINMFALFSIGNLCEKIIGKKRFLWFYLISGTFAGIIAVALSELFGTGIGEKLFGNPDTFMVGASGAIFAIAGLLVLLLPKVRFGIILIPFFSLPAYVMIPLVLLITWIVSYFAGWPIGNTAHLGGFLAGIVYGWYLRRKYKKKVMLLQRYFR
jgi:membrane associated rhomboid family serine protease